MNLSDISKNNHQAQKVANKSQVERTMVSNERSTKEEKIRQLSQNKQIQIVKFENPESEQSFQMGDGLQYSKQATIDSIAESHRERVIGTKIQEFTKKVNVKELMKHGRNILNRNTSNLTAEKPENSSLNQRKQLLRQMNDEGANNVSNIKVFSVYNQFVPTQVYPRGSKGSFHQINPMGAQKVYESSHSNIYGTIGKKKQEALDSSQSTLEEQHLPQLEALNSKSRLKHHSLVVNYDNLQIPKGFKEKSRSFLSHKNSICQQNSAAEIDIRDLSNDKKEGLMSIETEAQNMIGKSQQTQLRAHFESPYIHQAISLKKFQNAATRHNFSTLQHPQPQPLNAKTGVSVTVRRKSIMNNDEEEVRVSTKFEQRKSLLHTSRQASFQAVDQSQRDYQRDEKDLKGMRLSIEKLKNKTIDKLENMNLQSPQEWRDNLINYRIRRNILNREASIEGLNKEQMYNDASQVTADDQQSIKESSLEAKVRKLAAKNDSLEVLQNQTQRLQFWNHQREATQDKAQKKTQSLLTKNTRLGKSKGMDTDQYFDQQTQNYQSTHFSSFINKSPDNAFESTRGAFYQKNNKPGSKSLGHRNPFTSSKMTSNLNYNEEMNPSSRNQSSFFNSKRNTNQQNFYLNKPRDQMNVSFSSFAAQAPIDYARTTSNYYTGMFPSPNKSSFQVRMNPPQQHSADRQRLPQMNNTISSQRDGHVQSFSNRTQVNTQKQNQVYETKFPWSPYCNTCQVKNENLLQNRNFEITYNSNTRQSRLAIFKK